MKLISTAGAVAALLLPVAAQAETVRTTADLSLRTGPSTSYQRVAVIPRGSVVEATQCTTDYDWCRVSWGGQEGWSSANYLIKHQPQAANQPAGTLPPAPYLPPGQFQSPVPPRPQQQDRIADIGAQLAIPVLDFLGQLAAGEENPQLQFGAPAAQGSQQPGPGQVCFYEHTGYQGQSFCTAASGVDTSLDGAWNDRISSIRLGSNAQIEVCESYDFSGSCQVIASDMQSLGGGWNDIISSYRPVGGGGYAGGVAPGQVCFYEHTGYRGESFCTTANDADAGLRGTWNDRISSVRVGSNARIQVCEHYDYGGSCQVIASNAESLGGGWNDAISSYRPAGGGSGGGYASGAQPGQVCFYEHANYGGERRCVSAGSQFTNLGGSWNDSISSVRVGANAQIRVCEHYDAGGRCGVVSNDRASLGSWNDAISSYGALHSIAPAAGGGQQVAANEVCFYDQANYSGGRHCVVANEVRSRLDATFNDAISSIQIGSNATVRICTNFDFGGECATVTDSIASLGGGWNDRISSYSVQ